MVQAWKAFFNLFLIVLSVMFFCNWGHASDQCVETVTMQEVLTWKYVSVDDNAPTSKTFLAFEVFSKKMRIVRISKPVLDENAKDCSVVYIEVEKGVMYPMVVYYRIREKECIVTILK